MKDMNERELQMLLAESGRPLVIFFYTPLCGTCNAAKRMLEVAEHILPKDVDVVSGNVNWMPGMVNQYRITSVPALMVISAERKVEPSIYYAIVSVEKVLEYIRSVDS